MNPINDMKKWVEITISIHAKSWLFMFQAVAEIFLTIIEQPQKQLETSVKKTQDSEFDVHEMDRKSAAAYFCF